MTKFRHRAKRLAIHAALAGCLSASLPAWGQSAPTIRYDLPAQRLSDALRAVAKISGREVMFSATDVEGKSANRLAGTLTLEQAIAKLLEGTGLTADYSAGAVIIRGRSIPSDPMTSEPTVADVLVTGSRIRGAGAPSPVIVIGREDMRNAGQNTLADVVRDIPQNFGGGQNPGIGAGVPAASGSNIGSASSINLRGLGSDATLTLLNGHRLSYGGSRQSVDISAIPVLAVDRLEVIADGASAIYGSDAVAGVANIILKRDYQGVSTSARLGASTDGGNVQQNYGIIGGAAWSSGGFLAAYDFERDTAISAGQRSYTSMLSPGETLYPAIRHHILLISAHQELAPGLTLTMDGLYNNRHSLFNYPFNNTGNYKAFGGLFFPRSESFILAPSLGWSVAPGWEVSLAGAYGSDRTHYDSDTYTNGAVVSSVRGCYCNSTQSAELGANGSLFPLPGGDAKLAIGGGYRRNALRAYRTVGSPQNIDVAQTSRYGFGELSLPLIGARQNIPFVHELKLSAALRYEDYSGIDRIGTPKVGLVYAPSPDLSLKGSWGKSFKAPTMYQQYSGKIDSVYPVASVGGTGYAAGSTVILVTGGNPGIKPERATSWTATLDLHPRAVPGLQIEASYFNVAYRDRIVAPITFTAQSLSNPIYQDLVNRAPTAQDKIDALANTDGVNYLAGAYDPATVVAIVDNRNRNAARQTIRGVDLALRYAITLGDDAHLSLRANGSYIESRQKLSANQPEVPLAGTVFNPPHFKGRSSASWSNGNTTLTAAINYLSNTDDVRYTPVVRAGAMTTLDLAVRHKISGHGLLGDLDLALSAQNFLNAKPDVIRQSASYSIPYDSTNLTPFGRFVSLSIEKRW
ncbi:MAG: hypothetical protein JWN66_3262 [Sphingomonas bacterium]|uniref:TonB-dependent receptor n=1 Tax=Sphingomonas bacterium TaxID=1895847 RepID=UPI0026345BC3|nr:TonB-dependent receptor [Sphingomonas bacterium]MDB5706146.1 hypothetical protein [Sphingomonas bacterium]